VAEAKLIHDCIVIAITIGQKPLPIKKIATNINTIEGIKLIIFVILINKISDFLKKPQIKPNINPNTS
jgi:hypothetical protein